MSREELYGLATDMDRLVGAGANTAVASDRLRDRGKVVTELAKKVPTLLPLAQAIDKLRASSGKGSANALLDLLVMTQQLRRSLTTIGVAGELTKNPHSGSWKTPLSTRQFRTLHETVSEQGSDRQGTLERAWAEGNLLDLRLLDPILTQAETPNSPVWHYLAETVLPGFGKEILPELEGKLDIKGKSVSARLLPVLCKIDAERGRKLCLEALEAGSIPMKEEAIKCLVRVGKSGEADEWATKLSAEKSEVLHAAGVKALGDSSSAAAFDTLFAILKKSSVHGTNQHASHSLTRIKYPETTRLLIERLPAAVEEAKRLEAEVVQLKKDRKTTAKQKPAPAKAKKTAKKPDDTLEEAERHFHHACEFVNRLIEIIVDRKEEGRRAATPLILSILDWKGYAYPEDLLSSLTAIGGDHEEVRALVEARLDDKAFPKVGHALDALRRVPIVDRAAYVPKILSVLNRPKAPEWVLSLAFACLEGNFGSDEKAVLAAVRSALAKGAEAVAVAALEVIRVSGQSVRHLLPEVLEWLNRGKGYYQALSDLLRRLDATGESVIPKMIETLEAKSKQAVIMAAEVLAGYGKLAAPAVPTLEKRLKDKDFSVRYHIEAALREIQ